jgi:hypothetical protein
VPPSECPPSWFDKLTMSSHKTVQSRAEPLPPGNHFAVDLILSLSKDEVVARSVRLPSWFDKLTMRSKVRSCGAKSKQ